jgi:vesicle-fusing ATPase
MEISLPDEHGRYQILNIHTTRMKEFKKIADDVNMKVKYLLLLILNLIFIK